MLIFVLFITWNINDAYIFSTIVIRNIDVFKDNLLIFNASIKIWEYLKQWMLPDKNKNIKNNT